MLPPEAIQEFKQIYFRKFGEELSDKKVAKKANRFYDLHKALFDYLSAESQKGMNKRERTSLNK